MKLKTLAKAIPLIFVAPAFAQQTPAPQEVEKIEITGSNIKRVQSEGALPVQVITRAQLDRQGVTTVEQLLSTLSVNGNGFDNLASNTDVAAGAQRGNSGLSAANLRGQGSNATLILLNGRRVAAHGLSGGVVDLNQIPLAAIERVEVLKDGASAIYGTDAIGGVINFILRKDFSGVTLSATADVTQHGGGNVFRAGIVGGTGSLAQEGYNIVGSIALSKVQGLYGKDRDFVNTFQPERGLSVDTRGTPYATAFAITSIRNALSSRNAAGVLQNGTGPTQPGTTQAMNGINPLDLPGQAGCASVPGMSAYDELLWATPAAKWGCAWDTGKAAALQQPVESVNGMLRGVLKVNSGFSLIGEAVIANVISKKTFSNNQISSSNVTTSPFYQLVYPSTGSSYTSVFNALVALFPSIEENRGQGIAYRWRCEPCGPRQIETESDTSRFMVGGEGAFGAFDYRFGLSQASSESTSTLAGGYFFNDKFSPLLRSGVLNPFVAPGQSQTQAAIDALNAASASGTVLYGGKFTLDQADASISGPLAKIAAGEVMGAAGIDVRREKYRFNGTATDLATRSNIFNAPFDTINDLNGVSRDIKAVYAEVLVPVVKGLEVTGAVRHDRYTGFGGTTNPKISFRFNPVNEFLLRGSYNTGFRVPTFNQQFFGVTESAYSGKDLVDPAKCAAGVVSATPGCESITPLILFGGKPSLQPEKAKQGTLGVVLEPSKFFNASFDYWQIKREGTIQSLALSTFIKNYTLFPEVFIRDGAGNLIAIDQRWVNAGETDTKGIEVGLRSNFDAMGARWGATLDGTYLLSRKSRLITSADFGANEVGSFSRSGDIPVRWKHTGNLTYTRGAWTSTLTHVFSSSYKDAVLPGVANGTVKPLLWSDTVKAWSTFNLSATYSGIKNLSITGGVKNILDTEPPFSAVYDSDTGAGSSWEPRMTDPRGRSFFATVNYRF